MLWGGEHSLKISAPQLLQFVIYDILKIWRKRLTHQLTQLINYEGVCKTAPATPGLLIYKDLLVVDKGEIGRGWTSLLLQHSDGGQRVGVQI